MKKLIWTMLAAAAVACTDKGPDGPGPSPDEDCKIKVSAVPFAGPGGSLSFVWNAGDAVTVIGDESSARRFTLSEGAGTPDGVFSGKFSGAHGTDVTVVYPSLPDGSTSVTVQPRQDYSGEAGVNAYDVRAGTARYAGDDTEVSAVSMLCAIRFDIVLGPDYAGETLRSVEMSAAGKTLAGTVSATPGTSGDEGSDKVTVTLVSGPTAEQTVSAYALVLPADLSETGVRYVVTTDNGTVTFRRTPKDALSAGSLITVPLDISKFTPVEGEPGEGEYSTTLPQAGPQGADLNDPMRYGGGGTERVYANSYLVTESGSYYFDATVIGNGPAGILPEGSFHTSTAEISPNSAVLLWQDRAGLLTDVQLQDGCVQFSTAAAFTPGNALIGVLDEAGTILWSWHIWITEQPEIHTHINLENHNFALMDRNLGATSTTPGDAGSLGLLYQWGRKDPFPNSSSAEESVAPVLYDIEGNGSAETIVVGTTSTEKGTVQYTVANPVEYLCATEETSRDWYHGGGAGRECRNFHLWGNPEGYDYKDISETKKTIYDPCPVGYRVPGTYAWSALTYDGHFTPVPDQWSVEGGFNYGYMVIYDGTNTSFYPANGCFSIDGYLEDAGSYGNYWQNGPFSATSPLVVSLGFSDWYIHPDNESNTSTARAVRCVRE